MKPGPSYADRRAFGRRETNIKAMARTGNRMHVCTIKDISEGGALLEFQEKIEMPARLWLRWEGISSEILCEVRHSRAPRIGVEFSRPIVLEARHFSTPFDSATRPPLVPAPPVQRAPVPGANSSADLVMRHRQARRADPLPSIPAVPLAQGAPTLDGSPLPFFKADGLAAGERACPPEANGGANGSATPQETLP